MKRANHRTQEHRLFCGVGLGLLFRNRRFLLKKRPLAARVLGLRRLLKDTLAHAHRPDAFSKSFRVSESPLTVASTVPVRLAAKR